MPNRLRRFSFYLARVGLLALTLAPVLICLSVKAGASELAEVKYTFDKKKLAEASDPLHFMRAFVDYFYLSFKANKSKLPTIAKISNESGWCVGDAHPENFGVILQVDGAALFTVNDMDDSGECPLVLDLYRLMVSSRLFDSSMSGKKILEAYLHGLRHQSFDKPQTIKNLLNEGEAFGLAPSDKKIHKGKFDFDGGVRIATPAERKYISSAVGQLAPILDPAFEILDIVANFKVSGGSAGVPRFEVLLKNGEGDLLQLEFKEEERPSLYPVSPKTKTASERISTTVEMEQGDHASPFYTTVQVLGRPWVVRPKFSGNLKVELGGHASPEDKEVMHYEAYVLGLIHSRSVQSADNWANTLEQTPIDRIRDEVTLMADYLTKKFKKLK